MASYLRPSIAAAQPNVQPLQIDLDEDYLDPVTLEPLTEAVVLLPCGHSVNAKTAEALKVRGLLCPIGQEIFDQTAPNPLLAKIVREKVKNIPVEPPSQSNEEISSVAEKLCEQGEKHYDHLEYVKATTAFLGAVLLSPSYTKARLLLDMSLEKQKKKNAASSFTSPTPAIPSAALSPLNPLKSEPAAASIKPSKDSSTSLLTPDAHMSESTDATVKSTKDSSVPRSFSSLPPLYSAPPPQPSAPGVVNNYHNYDNSTTNTHHTYAPVYHSVYAPHDSSSSYNYQIYAPQFVYAPHDASSTSTQHTYAPQHTTKSKSHYSSSFADYSGSQNDQSRQSFSTPTAESVPSVPPSSQLSPAPKINLGSALDFSQLSIKRSSPNPSYALPGYVLQASNAKARGKALIRAIDEKNTAAIEHLLQLDTDVNAQDADQRTPLYAATEKNLSEILQNLIDHGAKTTEDDARRALILAIERNFEDLVEILVKENVPVMILISDIHRTFHCEALDIAAKSGKVKLVKILLESRTKPLGVKLESNYSYFQISYNYDRRGAVTIGRRALNLACQEGHFEVAKLLLDAGAIIGEALCYAAEKGDQKIIELLSDRKYKDLLYQDYPVDGSYDHQFRISSISTHIQQFHYLHFNFMERALFVAIKNKHLKVAEFLLRLVDLNRNQSYEGSDYKRKLVSIRDIALTLARENDLISIVEQLQGKT